VDDATKKKVLVGVLGVLALGAGTYYFVFRDTGPKVQASSQEAATRREKAQTNEKASRDGDRRERPAEKAARDTEEGSERRTREEGDDEGSSRRARGRDENKVKKKEMKPAS